MGRRREKFFLSTELPARASQECVKRPMFHIHYKQMRKFFTVQSWFDPDIVNFGAPCDIEAVLLAVAGMQEQNLVEKLRL